MTETTWIVIGIIASTLLGILSNWAYDLLRARGYLTDRPNRKQIIIVIAASVPIIALAAISSLRSLPTRSLPQATVTPSPGPLRFAYPQRESGETYPQIYSRETLLIDNCGGEQAAQRVIERSLEPSSDIELQVPYSNLLADVSYTEPTKQYIRSYMGLEGRYPLTRSLTLIAPPGHSIEFTILLRKEWHKGSLNVYRDGSNELVNFRALESWSLETVITTEHNCPAVIWKSQ